MSRRVDIKAVRSDGRTFNYNTDDWGIIGEIEGIDFPPVEIFKSDRGFGNGSIITGKRKGARNIDFTSEKRGLKNNERDRAAVIGFHNSNYTYDLYLTYMGNTRIAKNCELENFKCPSGNIFNRLKMTISFLMPDADLLEPNADQASFIETTPLWHVTRVYTEGGSLPYGHIERVTTKEIQYFGSEPTPFCVTVKAEGYVENMNVGFGGDICHVECELSDGDVLVIDAESRTVTLNGEKLAESLYDAPALQNMILEYGTNDITVVADDIGNLAFDSEITYTGRHGGL